MAYSPSHGRDTSARCNAQNLGDSSRTTEGPSAAQWESQKEEIHMLYDEYPLKEVKRILDARGFVAT